MRIANFPNKVLLTDEWYCCYDQIDYNFTTIDDINTNEITVIKATVPGNFEIDLLNNHLIDDVYYGSNIEKSYIYESYHKWYFKEFEYNGDNSKLTLCFEGLDCITDVYLNGKLILQSNNMLISHEVLVEDVIKNNNELVVHFYPVKESALQKDYPLYCGAFPFNVESLHIRKAPHMYGWDIFPRLISAGIFKECYLYQKTRVIEEVHVETMNIYENHVDMLFYFSLAIDDYDCHEYTLIFQAKCKNQVVNEQINVLFISGKQLFTINNPFLWWPKGKGNPDLYEAKITLEKNGIVIEQVNLKFGIRIVKLLRSEIISDKKDSQFIFNVNHQRVFILGTNWVPADALHSKDHEHIEKMIELVNDLGCNMIRCWGGNLYEDDIFYELCDKHGIMVWQDFSFGCAVYPQDENLFKDITKEAISVIKRLRTHACLVLWAGDNEVDCAHSWFGGNLDPAINKINRKLLSELVLIHDPYKEYLPSSPYISSQSYDNGSINVLPEYHLWGPRDYYKSNFYKLAPCYFASEIGYHGCPSPKSIKKFISSENIWPYKNNREWLLHCTSPMPDKDERYNFRIQLMANQIGVLFGQIPNNLEEFSLASQISQAEAMKFFIELFRQQKWKKTGIIWWNLRDGWPQFSDAIVDYYFEKKLAYDYIKKAQQPLLVIMSEPINGYHEILIVNDFTTNLKVKIKIIDEENRLVFTKHCYALEDEVIKVGIIPYISSEKHFYKITYESNSDTFTSHYLSGNPAFSLDWYKKQLQ